MSKYATLILSDETDFLFYSALTLYWAYEDHESLLEEGVVLG